MDGGRGGDVCSMLCVKARCVVEFFDKSGLVA